MSRLFRSKTDSMIAGVCGGMAEHYKVDSTWVRLLVILAFFMFGPFIAFAYLIMVVIVPEAPDKKKHPRKNA